MSKHLSFFTLKDGDGQTQLLVRYPKAEDMAYPKLDEVPVESVVLVEGKVVARPGSSKRTVRDYTCSCYAMTHAFVAQDASTGEVEVHVETYTVLNPATELPFRSDDRFELVCILLL